MRNCFTVLLFIILVLATNALTAQKHEKIYIEALNDAMYPTKAKVYNNLFSVRPSNKKIIRKNIEWKTYIRVVTFVSTTRYFPDAGKPYNTTIYPIWVTIAPEMKERVKKLGDYSTMRLKQLLGLPPTAKNDSLVEFWVRPADLFRPCNDTEIYDSGCQPCDEKLGPTPWVKKTWVARYYDRNPMKRYPWTQLGYTYDWNPKNKTHIGLSEYVIPENTDIIVYKKYSRAEYFK